MRTTHDLLIAIAENKRLSGFAIDEDVDPEDDKTPGFTAWILVDDDQSNGYGVGGFGTTKSEAIDVLITHMEEVGLFDY